MVTWSAATQTNKTKARCILDVKTGTVKLMVFGEWYSLHLPNYRSKFLGARHSRHQPALQGKSAASRKSDCTVEEQGFPQLFKDHTGSVVSLLFVSLGICSSGLGRQSDLIS